MSHTASKTWVSDEAKEYDIFLRVRDNYPHIAPTSPFTPHNWSEWIAHRLFTKEEARKRGLRRLKLKEMEQTKMNKEPVKPAFAGKDFGDYLSSVLSRESIWLPSLAVKPGRPQAPWPSNDELKHEGSYRSTSGYCRFPPLPRIPGNITVNWKQRSPIQSFSFDEVGRPTLQREEAAPETDDKMIFLVGDTLLKELDP